MKKTIKQLALLLIAITFVSSCTYVTPKEVTIRVHELGDKAGEMTIMKKPGKYSMAGYGNTDYSFPIIEKNYKWTKGDDENSRSDESILLQIEGNDCTIDIGIRFYIDNSRDEQLKFLVGKYPTNLDGIVDGVLFDIVRGAVKSEFEGKELDYVMDNLSSSIRGPITDSVTAKASAYAITVVEVYDISGLNAPDKVMEAKRLTQQSAQKIMKAQEDAIEQSIRDSMMIRTAIAYAQAIKIKNSNQPTTNVLKQQYIEKWDGVEAPGGTVLNLNSLTK